MLSINYVLFPAHLLLSTNPQPICTVPIGRGEGRSCRRIKTIFLHSLKYFFVTFIDHRLMERTEIDVRSWTITRLQLYLASGTRSTFTAHFIVVKIITG